MTSKDAMITKVIADQHRVQMAFARDRSNPFFSVPLTMSQLKILFALRLHGAAGGQELAQMMGVSLATITGIIDRLVASGHVTRGEDPRDRRVRRIELTDKGTTQIDEMMVAGERHLRRVLERLTVKELQLVSDAMEIMWRVIAEDGLQ